MRAPNQSNKMKAPNQSNILPPPSGSVHIAAQKLRDVFAEALRTTKSLGADDDDGHKHEPEAKDNDSKLEIGKLDAQTMTLIVMNTRKQIRSWRLVS
jgi:hypothetical protein